jgi:hypothetical protein
MFWVKEYPNANGAKLEYTKARPNALIPLILNVLSGDFQLRIIIIRNHNIYPGPRLAIIYIQDSNSLAG